MIIKLPNYKHAVVTIFFVIVTLFFFKRCIAQEKIMFNDLFSTSVLQAHYDEGLKPIYDFNFDDNKIFLSIFAAWRFHDTTFLLKQIEILDSLNSDLSYCCYPLFLIMDNIPNLKINKEFLENVIITKELLINRPFLNEKIMKFLRIFNFHYFKTYYYPEELLQFLDDENNIEILEEYYYKYSYVDLKLPILYLLNKKIEADSLITTLYKEDKSNYYQTYLLHCYYIKDYDRFYEAYTGTKINSTFHKLMYIKVLLYRNEYEKADIEIDNFLNLIYKNHKEHGTYSIKYYTDSDLEIVDNTINDDLLDIIDYLIKYKKWDKICYLNNYLQQNNLEFNHDIYEYLINPKYMEKYMENKAEQEKFNERKKETFLFLDTKCKLLNK